MKIKSLDILSIDAKDIYLSNNYVDCDNIGYNIRASNGEINIRKFTNSADLSIELMKLKEIYERVYRNTAFSFSRGKHEYTTQIINITFKYSVKLFNEIRKNIYVKNGYDYQKIVLNDGVCIKDGELIAVNTNVEIQNFIDKSLLGKCFDICGSHYVCKHNKTVLNTNDLHNWIYKNGFYCDGVKYVRYKRSNGASRLGKCLFINKKLYSRIHKWEKCKLHIKQNQDIDLPAWESYISLPLSSIIGTIDIEAKNILLIQDYHSVFDEDVIETKLNGVCFETKPNRCTIANSIWDGQSLLDKSLFGEYENKCMILLRNRFFKSACFNTNIQQWFADNNITKISQLNGFTLAKKISDIKLITTPSSVKYLKFGTIENWLENLESIFGVVKYEKQPHYFNGEMTQTHYQLLNTLHLSKQDMTEFLAPALKYLHLIKTDPSVLRFHIKHPINEKIEISTINSKNDIIYKLLGMNENFHHTKLYYDFRDDLVKSYIKNLKSGHVLVNGNYSIMCGNPIEMLQHAVGMFNGISQIGVGNIHSTRFDYDCDILGSRSPHICPSNILLTKNTANELIDKYLNLTKEVVCVNSINENLLNRLSGCD